MARRQDKPSAVAWILKKCPEMSEQQIIKLIGTTKTTIASIRERTHWDIANIVARDPVLLGLCSQKDFDEVYIAAKERAEQAAAHAQKVKDENIDKTLKGKD